MAPIARFTDWFLASPNENFAPAFTTAAMTFPLPYAESPRTRMFFAPAAFAVLIASVTMLAAPFPEPALPARSRIPAITGADLPVLIVVTSGDKPLRSTCRFAIFVCPNDAPCLACP